MEQLANYAHLNALLVLILLIVQAVMGKEFYLSVTNVFAQSVHLLFLTQHYAQIANIVVNHVYLL